MSRPWHVVFVTTSYPARPFDPSGHFVQCEAEARASGGARVTVLAPTPSGHPASLAGEQSAEERDGGTVNVEWLRGGDAFGPPGVLDRLRDDPRRAIAIARFLGHARARLRDLSPDAVVAHWLVPSAWPVALVTSPRIELEVVAHGSDVRLLERLPRVPRLAIVRALARRGARFRFVSHELRERLARSTDARFFEAATVLPSPIDLRSAPSREAARRSLGVGDETRLAVIVARLVRSKRVDVAVRLAREAGAQRVVVVGDGPEAARIARADARVELVGAVPRDQALAWIAAADLLVSASLEEGAPTVVREARALGVPVLAVPSGDLARWAATDPGLTLTDAG